MTDAVNDTENEPNLQSPSPSKPPAGEQAKSPIGSQELKFDKGHTLYEEGAKSDGAFLILEGKVDLYRQIDGEFRHLATIDDGNIIGETSIIRREPRSTTARARTTIRCLLIDGPALRQAISDPLINMIFRTLSGRLADRYVPARELLRASQNTVTAEKKKKRKHTGIIELEGVSNSVQEKLMGKVNISQYPFHIGNTRSYGELAQLSDHSLMMPLPAAPDLDSKHFEFLRRGDALFVRDLGSKAGTVVNGELLRKGTKLYEIMLEPGETVIGTGGLKSKVTFVARLREIG